MAKNASVPSSSSSRVWNGVVRLSTVSTCVTVRGTQPIPFPRNNLCVPVHGRPLTLWRELCRRQSSCQAGQTQGSLIVAVDSRILHGNAALLGAEEVVRLRVYAVDRATDTVPTPAEVETQKILRWISGADISFQWLTGPSGKASKGLSSGRAKTF